MAFRHHFARFNYGSSELIFMIFRDIKTEEKIPKRIINKGSVLSLCCGFECLCQAHQSIQKLLQIIKSHLCIRSWGAHLRLPILSWKISTGNTSFHAKSFLSERRSKFSKTYLNKCLFLQKKRKKGRMYVDFFLLYLGRKCGIIGARLMYFRYVHRS